MIIDSLDFVLIEQVIIKVIRSQGSFTFCRSLFFNLVNPPQRLCRLVTLRYFEVC